MDLSICIPTYNRAVDLRVLLDSILRQQPHGLAVEIAISDNASTDDTAGLIESYVESGISIVYDRLGKNIGFDGNILNAVRLSSGKYCWLFGSDDVFEPDAFAVIEGALRRHPTAIGFSAGAQAYTADLSKRIFVDDHISTEFRGETALRGRDMIVGTIGAWLGFMSSLVVRRDAWMSALAAAPIEPYLKGYVHTYLVARALNGESIWVCIPDRIVDCRTGNESFKPDDSFARTRVDIVGYDLAFGDTLGRDAPAYRQAMTKVANFYIRNHFIAAKRRGVDLRYWTEALSSSYRYYIRYPSFWVKTLPIILIPRPVFRLLYGVYQNVIKPMRK